MYHTAMQSGDDAGKQVNKWAAWMQAGNNVHVIGEQCTTAYQ